LKGSDVLITLTFEATANEIEHAARTLTLLKTDFSRPRTGPGDSGISSNSELARQWWSGLSKRFGPDTRRMAEAAAQMSSFGAWQDLATALGTTPKTVQSWHRNAGRSIKRVNEELGTSYQLFGWNVALNKFAMADEVRSAILDS
jgi:hypothetical protein